MYVWESLGNNVCFGIPKETMSVWEALLKPCVFGNPLGSNVCLRIPWRTMYVWESLGKVCLFGNPLRNIVCLWILCETIKFGNPTVNHVCLGIQKWKNTVRWNLHHLWFASPLSPHCPCGVRSRPVFSQVLLSLECYSCAHMPNMQLCDSDKKKVAAN